jgi:hypothetical protein
MATGLLCKNFCEEYVSLIIREKRKARYKTNRRKGLKKGKGKKK